MEWQLSWLSPQPESDFAVREVTFMEATALPRSGAVVADSGVVLQAGALAAWWDGGTVRTAPFQLRGYLVEDHHGSVPDNLPTTRGVVRQIDVATCAYRREFAGGRSWVPVPGSERLRPVRKSPKWFRHDLPRDDTTAAGELETGLLIMLDVADREVDADEQRV